MGITANGYETTPVEDIKADVQQLFKDALGEDLDLSEETPQGNLINAFTDMLHQIDMNRQADFYSRDMYKAVGTQLDIIGRELRLPRKEAVPTQILVSIQGAVNYKIAADTLASITTDSTKVFKFTSDVEITSSPIQVTLTAVDNQNYENLSVGQKLQTQDYVPQIYDISILSIVYGQAAESDYVYRLRLLDARDANVDEIKHFTMDLEAINNVLSAYVEPNNTTETSPSGIPPHAVEIVVLGGDEDDIAKVIMNYIFATPTYDDPVLGEEIQALDYNDHVQTFYITRPLQVNVDITVTYVNKPGQAMSTGTINEIKAKLAELVNSRYMNKTLYESDLYNLATEGYVNMYAVNSIEVTVGGTTMVDSYTCTAREYLYSNTITFTEAS